MELLKVVAVALTVLVGLALALVAWAALIVGTRDDIDGPNDRLLRSHDDTGELLP